VSDHLAKEADRLKNDELFNTALDAIRSEALNALAIADADDITVMLRLQQRVAVIDEIRATLDRSIHASEPAEDTGSYA